MARKKNYFVIEILDPETDAKGPLHRTGVRLRWTADAEVLAKPGMRDRLSGIANEFMELVGKRITKVSEEAR